MNRTIKSPFFKVINVMVISVFLLASSSSSVLADQHTAVKAMESLQAALLGLEPNSPAYHSTLAAIVSLGNQEKVPNLTLVEVVPTSETSAQITWETKIKLTSSLTPSRAITRVQRLFPTAQIAIQSSGAEGGTDALVIWLTLHLATALVAAYYLNEVFEHTWENSVANPDRKKKE